MMIDILPWHFTAYDVIVLCV